MSVGWRWRNSALRATELMWLISASATPNSDVLLSTGWMCSVEVDGLP